MRGMLAVLAVVIVAGLWGNAGAAWTGDRVGYDPYLSPPNLNDQVPASPYTLFGGTVPKIPEINEAYEKGMSINALRAWKAEQFANDVRMEKQSLYIGGGVTIAGLLIAVALYLSRQKSQGMTSGIPKENHTFNQSTPLLESPTAEKLSDSKMPWR